MRYIGRLPRNEAVLLRMLDEMTAFMKRPDYGVDASTRWHLPLCWPHLLSGHVDDVGDLPMRCELLLYAIIDRLDEILSLPGHDSDMSHRTVTGKITELTKWCGFKSRTYTGGVTRLAKLGVISLERADEATGTWSLAVHKPLEMPEDWRTWYAEQTKGPERPV